ncbi:histone-arginine methyltransferase METTL23 isoform X2 [Excalfactoria chinensis]|uniref:histone-arginine methyltransferase METTL23 isoform X2 n=1 Tax=Excalfactoria chinensis TaxID=46218 RepID=UPI003B3A197B
MEEPRCAVRRYRFEGEPAGLAVRVPEVPDPQYGMYAWPCAVVLAQYVWFHRSALPGRRVLESCLLNRLPHVPVIGITWGRISPQLLSLGPIDIILGSDVFFDPKDFEDILTTVSFLLEKNPHAQFWTTYQVRSADWSIEALLYKWQLKSIHIPLHSFSADKEHLASSSLPSRHTIEMMIISLARSDGT